MLLFCNSEFSDNVNSGKIYAAIKFIEQSIVLSDLFMINITILFSQFTLFFKLI